MTHFFGNTLFLLAMYEMANDYHWGGVSLPGYLGLPIKVGCCFGVAKIIILGSCGRPASPLTPCKVEL